MKAKTYYNAEKILSETGRLMTFYTLCFTVEKNARRTFCSSPKYTALHHLPLPELQAPVLHEDAIYMSTISGQTEFVRHLYRTISQQYIHCALSFNSLGLGLTIFLLGLKFCATSADKQ